MSFDLILTRSASFTTRQQLEQNSESNLTRADFELIMDGAPIRRKLEDGTCWLWHPQGMPWLSASFKRGKEGQANFISFSISYGHNQFLKVLADTFDLALRMARHVGARVFESKTQQEITCNNAAELLAPHGLFITEQADLWMRTVSQLDERIQAPLEYPVGRFDAVNDYFIFFLDPEKPDLDLQEIVSRRNLSIAPDSLAKDRFALQDASSGSILTRVILRPTDKALQIRPFYWMEPFSRVASETINLASTLQSELGGQLTFRNNPLSPELKNDLIKNSQGLGVEFFLWLEQL